MSTVETDAESQVFRMQIEAGTFDTFLGAIAEVVDESTFEVSPDGIHVTAVGPAQIKMIDTTLEPDACASYTGRNVRFGANIGRLQEVADLSKPSDTLSVELDTETRRLSISGDGFDADVALINPDSIRDSDIPELDLCCRCVTEVDELERIADGSDLMSDHLAFETDGDELIAIAEGDIDSITFSRSSDGDGGLIEAEFSREIRSVFNLTEFQSVIGPMVSPVEMELDDEMPLVLRSELPSGPARTLIAPRIESE